jgi:hypothetical protein
MSAAARKRSGGKGGPPAKLRQGAAPQITPATYNAMWEAYCAKQSVRYVAKAVGVQDETARRYILGPGCPEHGMEPLRERWLRVQAAAQEEQELTVLSLRRGEMDWARKQLTALHGEMELAIADVRRRVQLYQAAGGADPPKRELSLVELVGAYERAVRLAEHLLGGPDVTVEGRKGFDPLDALSEEEAFAYATTGVLPESVRLAVAVEVPRRAKAPR